MQMAGDNQWQIAAPSVRRVDHLAIKGLEGILSVTRRRQIAWTQIWDCSTDRAWRAGLITQCNQYTRCDRRPSIPGHATDEMDSVRVEEMSRELQSGRRVMVAADEHELEMGAARQSPFDKLIQPLLRWNGRIDGVVHVTGDDEHVGVQFYQLAGQPVEECIMLDTAIESMKLLTKMPVRRMDYAQGQHLLSQWASHYTHDIIALAV
jgi:hypothetical protein